MRLPKKIATLLTITLVATNVGNTTFADTIQRVSSENLIGEGRWETAIEVSKKGWTSSDEAIIVNDNSIVDALSATPFAEAKNAPILLTQKDKLDEKTKAELKRLGVAVNAYSDSEEENKVVYNQKGILVVRITSDDQDSLANVA